MEYHPFEIPGRRITLGAHLESAPHLAEGPPACPLCRTVIDLEALEHSIKARRSRASPDDPITYHLSCSMPCFNEGCPVYVTLEVTLSDEEYDAWGQLRNKRLDYTLFRDGRPITLEAEADASTTAPPPCHCPACRGELDLASLIPLSEILISGVPIPQSEGPPQNRVTAYTRCPQCGINLTCACFAPNEELGDLRPPGSPGPGDHSQ